jgi:hypothetical protein
MKRKYVCGILISVAPVLISAGALAEFQCAPNGASSALPEADPFFSQEVAAWSTTTKGRPTEGNGDCPNVTVPGYEEFPTKRCSYADADAGNGIFPALNAEVIVLNPSSRQLAAWSFHACRTNGATDATMPKCLKELRDRIIKSNGAQFPVVGSVVESYCASSQQYGDCPSLMKFHSPWLRPRNTWFRDGVSVDYKTAQGVKWDDRTYSRDIFDTVFDVAKSDGNLNCT